jgi:D-sedoheptulose 7-phosphate isomerase
MSLDEYILDEFNDHLNLTISTKTMMYEALSEPLGHCINALKKGNKIILFGNGGSAADAQHIATELVVRFNENREAIAAISLATDTSALTAIGNDFGFENIFSRQIAALGKKGDIAIGISTSGNSLNILNGITLANNLGLITIGLTGGGNGRLQKIAKFCLAVPSTNTARIQEMHILIGHILCGAIENYLVEK